MATGYDGTIRIDSSIEPKGFNNGVQKLSMSMKGVMKAISSSISKVVFGIASVGLAVAAIGAAFIAVISVVGKFAEKLTNTLYKSLSATSAFRDKVVQLKGAFDSVKGAMLAAGASLLNVLAPVIMKIINWLVKAVNWVSMFIAALAGQKTVMQYVSGSVDDAADSAGLLAKNTKDAEKAAKGALAAFDEINVLQQDKEETSGGGGTGGNVIMQEVPIDETILEKVTKIKEWFKTAWENIKGWAKDAWDWISKIWTVASTWFNENVIIPIVSWFKTAWENIKEWGAGAKEWIVTAWQNVSTWFKTNVIDPLVQFWTPVFDFIAILAKNAWAVIKWVWGIVSTWFKETIIDPIVYSFTIAWDAISGFAKNAWGKIKEIWGIASTWFSTNIGEPLKRIFGIALDWVKDKWETIFNGIKNFMKGIINGIIDFINRMLSGAISGINGLIEKLNSFGAVVPGWTNIPTINAPQIPRLATGAVIPPNAEFAAILGDQRNGRNLEAPEGLIRQIIQEEIGNIQSEVEIKFGGSLGALIRELKPYIDKENTRIGNSLIKRSTI
jgi:hypothetical protein